MANFSYDSIQKSRQIFSLKQSRVADANQYTITFPHANGGAKMTVSFRDNIKSAHALFSNGVSYKGTSLVQPVPISVFESVGLTNSQAVALKFISSHEGNFDAINSYDKAIFSWGFIQFAGGAGGSLGALLLNIKQNEPRAFQDFFGVFGIDVESVGGKPIVEVAVPEKKTSVKDNDAWTYIKDNKQITAAFVRAGFHPAIIYRQIQQAALGYAVPALQKINVNLNIGGQTIAVNPITKIIRSQVGSATLIDLTVNQWITKTGNYFKQAIEQVAAAKGLRTLQQLEGIDEKSVLQQIVANAKGKDERVVKRVQGNIDSGMSFAK